MKRLLTFLVAFALVTPCFGADISLDGTPQSATSSMEAPLVFSMTTNTGADLLVVAVSGRQVGNTVASVTFGANTLTKACGTLMNTGLAEIWYKKNPTIQTANVTVTLNTGGVFVYVGAAAYSFFPATGMADGIGDCQTNTTAAATSLSLSGLLATTINKSAVVDAVWANAAPAMTAEANRLEYWNDGSSMASSGLVLKTTAGGVTMEWTFGLTASTMAGVVVQPEAIPAAGGNHMMLMGVGK